MFYRMLLVTLFFVITLLVVPACAQQNLVANPGFEIIAENGFFADWGKGEFGKVGKNLFVDEQEAREGKRCLRLVGVVNEKYPWTTCAGKDIPVKPETIYWITWWFKAKQPITSRTYLFLQTNLAQRVFPHTDQVGDFDWTFNIVSYRTRPGETRLHPVLTMQTYMDQPGTSWWDEIGVWENLPPELEAKYRELRPWDDVNITTAQRFAQTESCVVWGDRPETRIYPQDPVPANAVPADTIALTAPGRGHDVYQLVVCPTRQMGPVWLRFTSPTGPDDIPITCLRYKVARCVPVQEVRDKNFPLGPTPDPLVDPTQPEPVRPGQSLIFWIEWTPPAGSKPGVYEAQVQVLSGDKPIASIPFRLRRWGFDLPEVPHYRSMVMLTSSFIRRFYPDISDTEALHLGWDILFIHRLSGFNLATFPLPKMKDGKLELDWTRFDRILEAAKKYRASAITLGPMFGGGCSEGWKPRFKFAGFTPLADAGFDTLYVEFNRLLAERVRQAGLLDKAYVYPYDEPEPDYMDKIARLCDLIHQGAPDLKCLMTVTPAAARPLWGKVQAWIIPCTSLHSKIIAERRAAGDEIWIYNMTAAIEEPPLAHRTYMWRALRVDAQGGLLWNACWWNKINPWENPTAAPVPVGRDLSQLFRYQAGQASLFYPDPAGKGPLIPALRLVLIRQGVEDFDMLSELCAAWRNVLANLSPKAREEKVVAKARSAFIAPVMLDMITPTTCAARVEAVRHIIGNELEVAGKRPTVIAYPSRVMGRLAVMGFAEPNTVLMLNGRPVSLNAEWRFEAPVTEEELAGGLRWRAQTATACKEWEWAGLR